MKHLPLFFDLAGRRVVVVGEGAKAQGRADLARSAGAEVSRLVPADARVEDFRGASAAFIAYLSSLTNVSYSATQYALFSSMMLLAPKWLAGYSGAFVDAYDYPTFFTATALLGLPVLILIWLATRVSSAPASPAAT